MFNRLFKNPKTITHTIATVCGTTCSILSTAIEYKERSTNKTLLKSAAIDFAAGFAGYRAGLFAANRLGTPNSRPLSNSIIQIASGALSTAALSIGASEIRKKMNR